ncbi:nuclear transport factor 2 family protein [Actinoplanes sp. NPDC049596]|uniref:nuclear transport factor 2 family protein n=1 Tax=unclassified Actinoplanes TaxID=2626549 RepID=UPI00343C67CF
MDRVIADVLEAVGRWDRDELVRLLHPYLHWTEGGSTLRGRNKVLVRLEEGPVPGPPASCELRDGQVYRWVSAQGG